VRVREPVARGNRHLDEADASGRDQRCQRLEDRLALPGRNVLEHDVRVHQVELRREGGKPTGWHELHVAEALGLAVAARFGEHRG
jgi:hypothetical protein